MEIKFYLFNLFYLALGKLAVHLVCFPVKTSLSTVYFHRMKEHFMFGLF